MIPSGEMLSCSLPSYSPAVGPGWTCVIVVEYVVGDAASAGVTAIARTAAHARPAIAPPYFVKIFVMVSRLLLRPIAPDHVYRFYRRQHCTPDERAVRI